MEVENENKEKDQELSIMKKQLNEMQKQITNLILSLGNIKDQTQLNQTAKTLFNSGLLLVSDR